MSSNASMEPQAEQLHLLSKAESRAESVCEREGESVCVRERERERETRTSCRFCCAP